MPVIADTQLIGVSIAAALQGAGGGELCVSGGYSCWKGPPGAQTANQTPPSPLPLPLMSETCCGFKYVSALLVRQSLCLSPFRFFSFSFSGNIDEISDHFALTFQGEEAHPGIGMSVMVRMASTANSSSGWIPVHQAMKYSSIIPKCLS